MAGALRDPDTNVRFHAAHALGELRDARTAEALLGALRDAEWCVRDQAAWALRALHDAKLTRPLAAMLKEKDADVAHIAWLLREIGSEETFATFIVSLKSENAVVRRAAAEALVKIGGERIEQPLTELMAREKDPGVRAVAEKAVAKMTQADTVAAHWSFDDKNTTSAKDVSGRAVDGEIKGCTVAEGKVGAALRFGKGKFIELGRTQKPSVADTPFTIMAWVKTDAATGVVVARGGAFCGFSLYLKDGFPKFGIRRSKDGPADIVTGRETIGADWTHLAGVVKEDCIELHVNGKLAATAKTGGVMRSNGGQGMEIGFDAGNSAIELCNAFEGVIDEVKQFNAALSEKEIARQCQ
ncbi:MAG: HEAT repeat domain-containing protein [Verrucomicrobia bacterium]|nr:HEAT repeat domain-containing protein [Verrucomicrobiota bacterium]